MSDFEDYEEAFDDYKNELRPWWCRCGTPMIQVPVEDPLLKEYEWLCPYCDSTRIEEQQS